MLSSSWHWSRRATTRSLGALAGIALGILPVALTAQIAVTPDLTFNGARNPAAKSTSAEALVNLGMEGERSEEHSTLVTQNHYPKDSLLALEVRRAQGWLTALPSASATGIQMDPYGTIAVLAGREDLAKQTIAARLATPGLSFTDRAYTLQSAVSSFASPDYPNRLATAEQYLAQLDALGPRAAFWQFNARKPLIYAYYRLGRAADVARTGTHAFSIVGQIPYEWRGQPSMYSQGIPFTYAAVVDALSGMPDGKATIRAMNASLMANAAAPAALLAVDPTFRYAEETNKDLMKSQIALADRVGEPGKPLSANYWANRGASHDSQSVAVNDGKIRVIEIGSFTCGGCIAAVPGMERLHQRYTGVEFDFMTFGTGVWGNRIVPPKEEAEHLADHFVNKLHATFPIGIAMPLKHVATDDDGEAAVITTETWSDGYYPQTGKPTFYIVDGHGTIRRVLAGYGRDLEGNIANIIEFLQKESTH